MNETQDGLLSVTHKFLNLANRGIPKFDFFRQILRDLLTFSECHSVELWIHEHGSFNHLILEQDGEYKFESFQTKKNDGQFVQMNTKPDALDVLRRQVYNAEPANVSGFSTTNGNLFLADMPKEFNIHSTFRSMALIRIFFGAEKVGLLQLKSKKAHVFSSEEIQNYEVLSHNLGVAVINQRTQAALRERVKELSCLYMISRVSDDSETEIGPMMQKIVKFIKPAWQYPEISEVCIELDGKTYKTPDYVENEQKQTADIRVRSNRRGRICVVYLHPRPHIDEGPFLAEERNLIDTLAKQIALLVEQREIQRERLELQAQLRHADRLATIGQLSAGVAHELNEPLGNILGFAQLAKKCTDMPAQARQDIDKIVAASLHAREIIKKLMLFARQLPSQNSMVNLNRIVEEGMYFFEARCKKAGIEVIRQLAAELTPVSADPAQLSQVLVNLVVNAIQAMPQGGKLMIRTIDGVDYVSLIVEDTGCGMSEEVQNKIFIPFFTTKDVNEGTGLGLSVVHGILSAHKCKIKVESEVGRGSTFTIQFKV